MAFERPRLSRAQVNEIYDRQIKPNTLDRAQASSKPIAVIVGGPPGSGVEINAHIIRAKLGADRTILVSPEALREYHPAWQGRALGDDKAAERTQTDVERWTEKLSSDAIRKGINLVVHSDMAEPERVAALAKKLAKKGYRVGASIAVADRTTSEQTIAARYVISRVIDPAPRMVPTDRLLASLDGAVKATMLLEQSDAVDRIQLVASSKTRLYENTRNEGAWAHPAKATETLTKHRERWQSPEQKAERALRWDAIAQRVISDPSIPKQVAEQIDAWRQADMKTIEQDKDTAQLLQWGRDAERFRTAPVNRLKQQLPKYQKQIERLEAAIAEGHKSFANPTERTTFIEMARSRIADTIATGQAEQQISRDGPAR